MMLCAKTALILVSIFITATPTWAQSIPSVNILDLARKCNSLNNQNACRELASIAIESKDSALRKAAVSNLTDQPKLEEIAQGEKFASIRRIAVGKLTDIQLLKNIEKNDKDPTVRSMASVRLGDPSLKEHLKEQEEWDEQVRKGNEKLRRLAVENKINDLTFKCSKKDDLNACSEIAMIAQGDPDTLTRKTAVSSLTDQSLLAKIATDDRDEEVRKTADVRLTQQHRCDMSYAGAVGKAVTISNSYGNLERGIDGERFLKELDELKEELGKTDRFTCGELADMDAVVDQYQVAASSMKTAKLSPYDNQLQFRQMEIEMNSLMAAREYTEKMLALFYLRLVAVPPGLQSEVKEKIPDLK